MIDSTKPGLGDRTDIAIIGMSSRFPGARNVDEFWQNLRDGVESISLFSDEELLQSGVDPTLLGDPNYVKAGAILEDIDKFDASFFGFTPKEAQIMDPQHRLFIECAWNAIESAGYNPEAYKGSIGLYAGAGISSYLLNNLYCNADAMESAGMLQVMLSNDKDSLTTRVAYLLDLKGPCYTVQTYCSTSLVAVNIACSSLLSGECDMALAGGVFISVPQKAGYYYQEGGIASPDARCRAFDARAKGSPLGNGVATVVLKRLEDALADGDTIHAVIKGSAINNDGSLKVGYTAPGVRGQAGVIAEALANAGVEAESISYIEAHGTGTALGDAAELTALIKSFRESTSKKGFCAIGSAKTNVGHLDRAAGVTGLIKTVLSLKHKLVPPSLNYEEPNPQINLQDSPFYVNTELKEWKTNGVPRRAGVSAFGMGGTNAHVILEEAPVLEFSAPGRAYKLILLSARTETALEMATANLHAYLQQHADVDLADVAYTLQVGRKTFDHRRMLVCRDHEDALLALEMDGATRVVTSTPARSDRPVAFLFPGLGEQYVGISQELYQEEPVFRKVVDYCCSFIRTRLGLDLQSVLWPGEPYFNANGHAGTSNQAELNLRALLRRDGSNGHRENRPSGAVGQLRHTALAQPAVFVIEYALAQLLQQWGIHPQALLGYSLGEYVAACLSGVLSLEDALTVVTRRGQLIAQLPAGAMLAVALLEEEVQPLLDEQVCLAASNGPMTCVLAGPLEAIEQVEARLAAQGIAIRRIETDHAFHSSMLEPLREAVTDLLCGVALHEPQIPYLSNVSGTWITAEQATDPAYWAAHMCQPVRFAEGIGHLLQETECILLEVGPGQSLNSFVKQHPACSSERRSLVISTLPSIYEQQPESASLLLALGKLWLAGTEVDWTGFYGQERRQRVPLPTYPFERQRYWIEPPRAQAQVLVEQASSAPKGKKPDIADWFYLPRWEQEPLQEHFTQDKRKLRSPYLVFLDTCGIAEQVVKRLEQEGHTVICVQAGVQFTQREERVFSIRPDQSADYLELSKALRAAGKMPGTVLHCWSVTSPAEVTTGRAYFSEMQARGFYSLLFLAQALGALGSDDPMQVVVVSNEMQAVTGHERLCPEKATLLGACKVTGQEYQELTCRSIDLLLPEPGSNAGQSIIDQLTAECSGPVTDLIVAYRDTTRWIQSYQPVRLEANQEESLLRQQGVYLITGGLGHVGLVLAEYLAKTVQARLVLVGRSGVPDSSTWSDWLVSHDAEDPLSRRIGRLQALEAAGAEVLVLQADVADEAQMQAVIQQTLERFGVLHGVIHAAGISTEAAFRAIQEIGWAECEWHFGPKVYGSYVLERVLQGQRLDFCVLFSSLSAVLGGLGFVAYTAANLFLDAFVAWHNQGATVPWISVDWDSWQVKQDPHGVLGGTIAAFAMTGQEGVEALRRILGSGARQIVTSTGDLQARIRQWIRLEALQEPQEGSRAATIGAASKDLSPAQVSGDYEQRIAQIWQQVLGLEQVGLYDNFFDLGGNSLSALQVLAKLKKAFHVQLPVVALFEAPTISALVKYLQPAPAPVAASQSRELSHRRQQARQASSTQPIAIVALAGRFPGAASVEQFWHNLRQGVESVTFFSEDELLAAGIDAALVQQPNYVKARPILEQVDQFDAAFFGYSPREAALTDPQQRLFLECAWEALERAGYDAQRYEGLVGVFAGTNLSTYLLGLAAQPALLRGVDSYQLVIGNDKDALPTSVSYKLNLKGPSVAVQTFCSTSLVAVHLACQSLRQGECDLALAGGVSVRVPSKAGHLYQPGGMESPDGHCRTFDAQARGGLFGDGVGVVVLKRLAEALADGDQVAGVILGSAINNDGALKVSYTAPSVVGQAEVVAAALAQAGVGAETISYVEAHGTATELGDPIEVASLSKAFRRQTERRGYCAIGSVKTNIGHLDRAAGVSGLIKTVLALQQEEIPASLHFQTPNPEIDFARSPFYVNTQLRPWPRREEPRRAGVNSLGMGGTNAHVVLEEAPEREASGPSRPWQLLLLSARTDTALEQATRDLRQYLEEHEETKLADVAYTLQVGRRRFEQRRMLVCRTREEALGLLGGQVGGRRFEQRTERGVALLLPGVGEQYVGMAQELYEQEAVFREIVDRGCALLKDELGVDLRELLFPKDGRSQTHGHQAIASSGSTERLRRTAWAQPAVFLIEYALAQLLQQWGIRPQALLGYSLGEYVAACLSGVLSLEDALRVVARRAQWIAQLPAGAMLAVALAEEAVQPFLDEQVSLAASTGPMICVLAGPLEAIERVEARLAEQEVATRRVETSHAFHSAMLEPLQAQVRELLGSVQLHPPQIPYLSNVSGTWITAEQVMDPAYWAAHMCQPVRFAAGVEHLLQGTEYVLLEVGPGQSLSSFVKQHPACSSERRALVLSTLPTVYERESACASLLLALGKLWLSGVEVDWAGFYGQERRQRVLLPTYPFERQRYWIETNRPVPAVAGPTSLVDEESAKITDITDWFYLPSWKQLLPQIPFAPGEGEHERFCWLLFDDGLDIGTRLKEQLVLYNQDVIAVMPGKTFSRTGEAAYTVRPTSRADYEALLKELRTRGKTPQKIVHLWMVTPETPELQPQDEVLARTLERGFYSLLALAQALGDMNLEGCQLAVVSSNMQDVTGSERLCPEKATVMGPCKVIPQEYPTISCRSIDICLPGAGSWQEEELIRQLVGELTAEVSDTVVALRGNHRWLQTFEPMKLHGKAGHAGHADRSPWREGGVYLITGGLGGIGLAMAEHLARTRHARLVLVTRSGLPPRSEWDAWLESHEASDSISRKIQHVQALEALGSDVLALQGDVADEAQMRAVVQQATAAFGSLHGVLHTAGVPASGLIQLKTPEMAASVLAPKVMGTLVLERVLHDLPLDFLVLFSSMSSITGGGPGQIDYCAANTFLDAYAHLHCAQHGMTVAIDWGEWQWDAWGEGLLGFPEEAQIYFKERRRKFGIAFEEGAEALTRILAKKLRQVVVSTQDFSTMVAGSEHFSVATIMEKVRQLRQTRSLYARPALSSAYVAPENGMEQGIAAIWSELLGIEQIGIQDNFFELGGHSLMGMQMISRLRDAYQVDVRLATLFEAPTVAELAVAIEIMFIEEINKLGEEEAQNLAEGAFS